MWADESGGRPPHCKKHNVGSSHRVCLHLCRVHPPDTVRPLEFLESLGSTMLGARATDCKASCCRAHPERYCYPPPRMTHPREVTSSLVAWRACGIVDEPSPDGRKCYSGPVDDECGSLLRLKASLGWCTSTIHATASPAGVRRRHENSSKIAQNYLPRWGVKVFLLLNTETRLVPGKFWKSPSKCFF